MILKRADERRSANAIEAAGARAEKQMAHYLERTFHDDPNIFVYHDIRFEMEGDAAQIDHLVLYTCGFLIIESKSVTSTIRVNEMEKVSRALHRLFVENGSVVRTPPGAAWKSSIASSLALPERMSHVSSHSSNDFVCTVETSVSSRPARRSSPSSAGMPPARCTSSMW